MEEKGCLDHASIEILASQPGKHPKDLIREHLMDNIKYYVDFIFVGNKGADFSGHK